MNAIQKLLISLLMLLFPLAAMAQSPTRAELEKKKVQLQKDIQQASEILDKTKANRRQTLSELKLLQNKITLRNKLIDNINDEIAYINHDINSANNDIRDLQQELDTLKSQYATLVVYAYKYRSAYNMLNFIFSANSFNDAIKRYEYLKQYRAYRTHQATSIMQTQKLLKEKVEKLAATKGKRRSALTSEEGQQKALQGEREQKAGMVSQLKGREKELLADINEKKKETEKLNVAIAAVIRREIEEARRKAAAEAAARKVREAAAEKARAAAEANNSAANNNGRGNIALTPTAPPATTPTPARPANVLEATPEALALSENFESNKGKLPWPVARGFIIDNFGRHQHPVLDKVEIDNNGVDIKTNKDAVVRAIFNGEVASVNLLAGKWVVILRHGQYFTVYSNLEKVLVKNGDQVTTKQPIGVVYTDETNDESDVHFEIHKGVDAVNPSAWLSSSSN